MSLFLINQPINAFKWAYRLSGNDYRVATLSESYLYVTGIIIQHLELSVPNLRMNRHTDRCMGVRTDLPNNRKASLLERWDIVDIVILDFPL